MSKTNKFIFLFVFILLVTVCLFALSISNTYVAFGVENQTPRYSMTFDASYITRRYANSGLTTTQNNINSLTYKISTTRWEDTAIVYLGGASTSGTAIFPKDGSIRSNKITITTSHTNEEYCGNRTIEIFKGSSKVASATNSYTGTLSDGSYKLTISWSTRTGSGYSLYICDVTLTTTFKIDTTAPSINVSCGNNGFSKNNVAVTFNEGTAKYSYSTGSNFPTTASTAFTSGKSFTAPGNYKIIATDTAGNSSSAVFTIDKTAPTLSLSGVSDGGFTNGNVSASWSTAIGGVAYQRSNTNDTLTVKYSFNTNSSFPTTATTDYTSGASLTAAGNYLITITDKAGNSSSYTFTIDKTAPTLSLSGVSDGGFTNGNVSASWSTAIGGVDGQRVNANDTLTVKYSFSTGADFPSSAKIVYSNNFALTAEGNYRIEIFDAAGNSSSFVFTIDKTAPTLSLSGVSDGGFTNDNVSAKWTTLANGVGGQRVNTNDTLTVKYSFSTNSNFPTTATTDYTSGASLTAAGNYLITITDKAGNSNSYTFTIDKTAPTLSLSGVFDGGFTNGNVSASWSTAIGGVDGQRVNANDTLTVKYSFSTGADFPSSAKIVYSNNFALTAEGNYRIEIFDAAGNSSSFVFTIDKTAPTLSLKTSDASDFVNNRTSKNVSAFWSTLVGGVGGQRVNTNDTLTVKYSFSTGADFPSSAEKNYTEGELMTTEGKYLIIITDKAGNTTYYKFEIFRGKPQFIVLSESGEELNQETLAYNKNIKLVFENATARLNGESYDSGTLIIDEAEYNFVLTDDIGNEINVTIYIIKTPPTENYDRLQSSINRWYETANSTGTINSYSNYDNAYSVADERERATLKSGVWTSTTWDGGVNIATADLGIAAQGMAYYIYKSYESASTLNAYFSISTLNKSIEKYVISSIEIKYTPSIPAPAADGESIYRDIYFSKTAITFNKINNCSLYIDGELHKYPYTLTENGQHSIFEIDLAGNSISYTVVIDAAQPIVRVTNLNGNFPQTLNYGVTNYLTYGIRIFLDDIDDQSLLKINDEYYLGGVVELRSAGVYTITTRDAAGNGGNLTIHISLIEPTISITENEVSDVVNSFNVTISKNYTLNTINSLSILKYNDDSGHWETLSYDNSSSPVAINKNTLTYLFNVSGNYRIIIVDSFGRYIESEYNFIKDSPKGTLSTTGGTILVSGSSTKLNFYFTWSNLLDCSAEISLNGAEPTIYQKGTIVTKEGHYIIKLFSNVDDLYNIYEITIDKTAPTATLIANGEAIGNNATTRHPVSLSWEESGCTATINDEPYANGSAISEDGYYTIILIDVAGNKATFTFRIKTTPPEITLTTSMGKIDNYSITKYDVYISWKERNCICTVNGSNYTQNTKLNIENSYTVILTDAYGNTNTYFFSIDKTKPVGKLFVDDHEVNTSTIINTNKKVSFTWDELGCTATINDDYIYTSGSIISEDGTYTIKLTDKAGNVSEYSFIIKTTKPTAKLYANGVEVSNGTATRFDARLTWSESGCTATVNGEPYTKGQYITAEGTYNFILTDSCGNTGSWNITIDKTAPLITLTSNGEFLENGQITRYEVCYTWDDVSATAMLNNAPVLIGQTIDVEGEYTLIVTDLVGNKSTIMFIIDKTAKIGTLIANSNIINDGAITRYSVYYTWNGSYLATINDEPYEKGTLITAEGTYTIKLTDKAGNISSVVFTIDKTPATGTLYESIDETIVIVTSGIYTKNNIYFDWEESGCTATINDEPYEKGTLITAEGTYTIKLIDAAGNSSSFVFTIDKTAPVANAHSANNDLIDNNSITRYSIYVTWSESGCTATVNGEPYSKGTIITETGIYVFVISDSVGNTTTLNIEVYKISPNAEIIPVNDFVLPYLNDGFSITWSESGCTATINGEPYEKGTLITAEGTYNFVLTNKVGIETVEEIIIDRTAPIISAWDTNGNEIQNDISVNFIYFDWEESGCTATVNGEPYKAKTSIIKDGLYTIILTDAAGNSSTKSIRLAHDKPTASLIKEDGSELNNGGSTSQGVIVIVTSITPATILINNDNYNGDIIVAVGTYSVTITDEFGNSAEYSFTIKQSNSGSETNNPFDEFTQGSPAGTYVLISIFVVIIIVTIIVPLIQNKRKNIIQRKKK